MTSPLYCLPVRVYLEDTDAGGVVFYANYLKFFERARTEFVRSKGFAMREMLELGTSFVVSSAQIDYKKSAHLDDRLSIYVELEELSGASFKVSQWVENDLGDVLAKGSVTVVCVELSNGRPKRLPDLLVTALQQ